MSLLHHPSPQLSRAAAEALGRVGEADVVEPLLSGLEASPGERHLDHSLLYALIEVLRRNPTLDIRKQATSNKRLHATILVLDQLGRGAELDPTQLFLAGQSEFEPLRGAAIEVLASHPQWAADSTETLATMWAELDSDPKTRQVLSEIISGWREQPAVAKLVGDWITATSTASTTQQAFLAENLQRFSPRQLWPAWSPGIAGWIAKANPELQTSLAESLAQLDLRQPPAFPAL